MNRPHTTFCLVALSAVVAVARPAAAQAPPAPAPPAQPQPPQEVVTLRYAGLTNRESLKFKMPGQDALVKPVGDMNFDFPLGDFPSAGLDPAVRSFCLEPLVPMYAGQTYSFAVEPLATPARFGLADDEEGRKQAEKRAGYIRELYARHYQDLKDKPEVAAAAFQTAVWEVALEKQVPDGPMPFNLFTGSFQANYANEAAAPAHVQLAQQYVQSLTGDAPAFATNPALAGLGLVRLTGFASPGVAVPQSQLALQALPVAAGGGAGGPLSSFPAGGGGAPGRLGGLGGGPFVGAPFGGGLGGFPGGGGFLPLGGFGNTGSTVNTPSTSASQQSPNTAPLGGTNTATNTTGTPDTTSNSMGTPDTSTNTTGTPNNSTGTTGTPDTSTNTTGTPNNSTGTTDTATNTNTPGNTNTTNDTANGPGGGPGNGQSNGPIVPAPPGVILGVVGLAVLLLRRRVNQGEA